MKLKSLLAPTLRGAFIGAIALASAAALAWTGPTQAPPNGNTSAPINVSSTAQTKAGNLTVSGNLTAGQNLCLGSNCISSWNTIQSSYSVFGGSFILTGEGVCVKTNSLTGLCSCGGNTPNAYNVAPVGAFQNLYICVNT